MALVLLDRAQETATANTTVSFTLLGADTGYQTLAGVGNTNTTYYGASDGTNWEVGIGTYSTTGPTLTRTTILSSSNSGAAVSTFGSPVTVFIDYPSSQSVYENASGVVTGYAISGGTIDGTPIGATTRAAGSFTTVTTTNDASISGLTVGKGSGAVSENTAIGTGVLNANTTGSTNTGTGYAALNANTTGTGNTSNGAYALVANTTGSSNTAIGRQALAGNTTASNNTAVGYQAGYSNQTIPFLTAVGFRAGYAKTGADSYGSTFLGGFAGLSTTTGADNVFVGTNAGYANTSGTYNTTLGAASLTSNTTGGSNTAIGFQSLISNTTANNNTAVGFQSLQANTTASNNTAVGFQAGYSNTTGVYGTFLGYFAGRDITTGQWNIAIGDHAMGNGATNTANGNLCIGNYAGSSLTTGTKNTFIGGIDPNVQSGTGQLVTTGSANTIIGAYNGNQGGLDIRTASNYIVLSDGDGNPRQIIDGSGNVGIGTSTIYAGAKAQVNGALILGAGATPSSIFSATLFVKNGTDRNFAIQQGTADSTGIKFNTFNDAGSANIPIEINGSIFIAKTNETERMRITSAGDIGIGTTTPQTKFQLFKTSSSSFTGTSLGAIAATASVATLNEFTSIDFTVADYFSIPLARIGMQFTGSGSKLSFGTSNNYSNGITNTAVTIDPSGNVGIGTSAPPTRLTSYSTSSDYQLELGYASTFSWKLGRVASTGSLQFTGYNGGASPVVPMTFDLTGNVGIGTTPTAASQGIVLEMVNGSTIYSRSTTGVPQLYTSSNAVGTGFSPTYKINGFATQYLQQGFDGSHSWLTAASGTAGNAITFTERMRITSAGGVSFGSSGTAYGTSGQALISAGDAPPTWGDVVTPTGTQTLTNKTLTGFVETVFAVTGTTPALSPTNGTIQTWTLSGSSTPTASGAWVSGASMTLQIVASTNTVTWSSMPVTWIGGSAPTLSTTLTTVIELWEVGSTIYGALVGSA